MKTHYPVKSLILSLQSGQRQFFESQWSMHFLWNLNLL